MFQPTTSQRKLVIQGHRGGFHPDNTLKAF